MKFRIRRAEPAEAGILSEIAFDAKAHWGYPARWMEDWRSEFNFPPEFFETNENWMAVVDDAPVAFCTLQEKDGHAWLEHLWVAPNHIGQGIGKQLFAHAVELSRSRGFTKLRLESDPNAAGFYEKMGMYKIGERRADMDGTPRILPLMELTL